MKVVLAGYNVDTRTLKRAEELGIPKDHLTPEVISAAYARISRDPRPVGELRLIALEEVEKARASNRAIVFEMGHHSIAEHAVFNFDIVGVSRLAIEYLERFRLCSYTEKSQRYITLDHDFVIPNEFKDTPFESELLSLIAHQSTCYEKFNTALRARLLEKYPDWEKKKSKRTILDGWSKEDARYVTLLATTGQLGLTANARNLELMIRRFAGSKLEELRNLGKLLHEAGSAIAPSLLLFTETSSYDTSTRAEIRDFLKACAPTWTPKRPISEDGDTAVQLVDYTPSADKLVAASLLHLITGESFEKCRSQVSAMWDKHLSQILSLTLKHMQFYDTAPREFEHAHLTFEIVLSGAAYAQLKRHRMTTQSIQKYDPSLGYTVPPAITEVGLEEDFRRHMEKTEILYDKIAKTMPDAAPYVLTNAHRRRVLMTINLRELYHFVRLRDDAHAQWDIRNIAKQMKDLAKEVMPVSSFLLSGKDSFASVYERAYGEPPQKTVPRN